MTTFLKLTLAAAVSALGVAPAASAVVKPQPTTCCGIVAPAAHVRVVKPHPAYCCGIGAPVRISLR